MSGMLMLRADASRSLGGGHVMRCLALAQEWRSRGGEVAFVSTHLEGLAMDKLRAEGLPHVSYAQADASRAWWVVDLGQSLTDEDLAPHAQRTLVIDDLGREFSVEPRLVVNQNVHADRTSYSGVREGRILRGLPYVLLRDEFLRQRSPSRRGPVRRVLITLGSGDSGSHLPMIVEAVEQAGSFEVVAVASKGHPDRERLVAIAEARPRVSLLFDVADMSGLMAEVDLAVTSGGTTVWELAYHGVPAIVGTVSVYEERLTEGLMELGLNRVVGTFADLESDELTDVVSRCVTDGPWRAKTSKYGQRLVDGRGRIRVLDTLVGEWGA